jgi:hypothetical protein
MNTLVLNLTRFGDLLQTQPVVSGLKDQGRSVSLICLDNFVGATQFLQGISQVSRSPAPVFSRMLTAAGPGDCKN